MPIKLVTPESDTDALIAKYLARVESMITYNLCAIGEACINIGRSTDTYKDQTGNLRNSIGYVVVYNGRVVQQAMTQDNRKGGGRQGTAKGKAFIKELVGEHKKNATYLIVVAGMEYASYVSAKGMDVLDSAELEAEKLMSQFGFNKI